jgi:hypothetical protein
MDYSELIFSDSSDEEIEATHVAWYGKMAPPPADKEEEDKAP